MISPLHTRKSGLQPDPAFGILQPQAAIPGLSALSIRRHHPEGHSGGVGGGQNPNHDKEQDSPLSNGSKDARAADAHLEQLRGAVSAAAVWAFITSADPRVIEAVAPLLHHGKYE
ncbi:MAG: hypothetical protein EBZ48_06715, partial [Proteobacteria bacterium]|nr:hypothetical protein [Pseudomonadota bacterium]